MEASVDLSSPKKRPRPHYKALWQAEKKRADDLLAILNPPRFETAPTNQRITEPVVMHTEPYVPPTARKAWYKTVLDGEPLEWSRVIRLVAIITAFAIVTILWSR